MSLNEASSGNQYPWMEDNVNYDCNEREQAPQFDDNFQPFAKMPDSRDYIKALENRLENVKGKNKQLTSRGMLQDMGKRKDDHMAAFMLPQLIDLQFSEEDSQEEMSKESVSKNFLSVKLHPERQALSAEELLSLVAADQLNLVRQDNSTSSSEDQNENNR